MRKKKQIGTSWAGQYKTESSRLKTLDDIRQIAADRYAGIVQEITNNYSKPLEDVKEEELVPFKDDISRMAEERKRFEEDPDGYPYKEQITSIPQRGTVGQTLPKEKEDHYWKNWWNYHGRKMNQFQIDNFQGYIDRTKHWQEIAQGMSQSLDLEDKIDEINKQIEYAKMSPSPVEGAKRIEALQQVKELLLQQHRELKLVRDAFDSYKPSGVMSKWYNIVAGNADDGGISNIFSNNALFGRTGQLHDETGDYLRFTSQMDSPNISRARKRELLKAALDTSNDKIKEWQSAMKQNIADQESYGKVDDWFKHRADNAGTDIFSAETWMYGMPGLIAGSTSGSSKILPSMLIGIATAAGVAASGGTLAPVLIGTAGFGATAGLNYGAGIDENNAEVANAYKEKIEPHLRAQKTNGGKSNMYRDLIKEGRNKLGKDLTDEQIFDAFRRGDFTSNNAALNKSLYKLATGMESQFQDDMHATTYGALFESALLVIPVGKLLPSRALKYALLKNSAGRKLVRKSEKLVDNLSEGLAMGAAVNPAVGAMYAPIHATLVRPAYDAIGSLGKKVINSIGKNVAVSSRIPAKILEKRFLSDPKKRIIKDIAGRWLMSSISEGVEEGVQSISAEKFKSGEYDTDVVKSHLDSILDNVLAGSKSALLLAGMPFEGLMSESDRLILKEIKGGFLLGGLLTAMVNTPSAYFPYRSEMSAREAVANAVFMDKAKKMDDFKKGVLYAEAAKSGSSYRHIDDAFDMLIKENEKEQSISGEYGVDPKVIDQERERFHEVAKMANDAYSRKQAEAQGIKVGSKEYNDFIAAKALAQDKLKEEEDVLKQAKDAHAQNVNDLQNEILTKRMQKVSSIIPGAEQAEQEEETKGPDVTIQEDVDDFVRTQFVAQHAAMLRRKIDLELGIENAQREGKKRTEKILQQQLDNLNKRIALSKPVVRKYIKNDTLNLDNLEEFEQEVVLSKDWHDTLSNSYSQLLLAEDDYNLAKDTYTNVVGDAYVDGKPLEEVTEFDPEKDFDKVTFKNGKAKDTIKEVYATMEDDDNLASAIEEDHEERTDENEEEIITPEEKEEIQETAPENNPEEEFKEEVLKASKKPSVQPAMEVREKPVEAVSSPSEPVSPTQHTVVPEVPQTVPEELEVYQGYNKYIDDRGYNYWAIDKEEAQQYGKNIRSKKVNTKLFLHYYRDFDAVTTPLKNEFKKATGKNFDILDNSPEGLQTQREFFDFLKSKGYKGVTFYDSLNQEDNKYVITFDTIEAESANQRSVVDELHRRAELSKSRVKKVTSEYYLIQVGDELIQMPRVHSVMPKYWYGDGSYAAALQLGNAFDNLARIFFGDPEMINRYEYNSVALVEQLLQLPLAEDSSNPNALDMTYGQLYQDPEAFAKTIKDLYELAKQYRDLGWALSTDKIVWYSQFESGWVAGETDMLAVDRDGNVHIIDFKTAKGIHPFETYLNDDVYRTNKYGDQLSTLTEDDFKAGPNKKGLSKAARAVKRAIRQAEGGNKNIMLEWYNGKAVLRYADSEFTNNKLSNLRRGSKQQEYSDQLTAYAEMIQKQLANVVDLEIVGFRTQYTTDAKNNLTSVKYLDNQVHGKPFRIKLSFSDEMRSILNNEGAPVEPVEKPNSEVVEAKLEAEAIESTLNAETAASDKFVPKKSEDSLRAPNEPTGPSHEALGYFNINQQAIERDPELAKLVASPDFINEALQKGLVTLYTEEVTERGKKNRYLYADITYGDKTYKRLYIWDNGTLQRKVEELEKNANGKRIVATAMKRTAGKIKPRKDGKSVPVTDTPLLAGQKLEDLEFTVEDGRFGFIRKKRITAFVGGDITQPQDIYPNELDVPDGTVVFVKNPNHKENPTERIPVTVARKTFADSADFIVETLQQFSTADQPYLTTIDGKQKNLGVTRKQLMNLLLPIVKDIDQAASYSIMRNAAHPSEFHVVIRTQPQPIVSVDLLNPVSVLAFKLFLANTQMPLFNKVLVSRIGSDSNNTPAVFKGIKKFFGQNADVQSLSITPDIRFDRSDLLGKGLSGIGWYVKTGRLITNFEDIVAPLVSVGDAGYFGEVKEQPMNKVPTVTEQIAEVVDDDVVDIQFGDLQKRLTEKDADKPKLTPEKIKENLRPILGDEVDDPVVLQIITDFATDPKYKDAAVVGKAHKDGITIYSAAFEGVEYHEAFHRIFELFIPVELRDKLYNTIGKQLGLDLSKDSKENDYAQHRMVAEYVADAYMEYKAGEFKTRFSLLNRILNKIRDWVNRLFRISDRQLYKIFLEVNSGKYRSERRGKATLAQKKRFKDLFGELNYEVHGAKFTHIVNDPMYEDVKNTTFYCMMLGQDIDLSGKNVSKTKINRDVFWKGMLRLKEEGYDIFGIDVDPEMKSPGQLAMSEMYHNLDAVSDDIAAMFAAISTDYRKFKREEKEEDLDGDEISIASAWDENFFKWDYEFSRFDKSTSRVKYFFSSIPDMEYDENMNFVLSRNSLGMPQMLPMKYVFTEVLSQLWDVDTLDELTQRMWKLSHQHPMWAIISVLIQDLINRRNDADAEALLTQLMNTIRSNRHTFMIAKAVENTEKLYNIIIQTSSADYNAREYPTQWGQILAKGGSEILKVNQNGQLVFNPKNPEAAAAFQKIACLFDFNYKAKDGSKIYVGLRQMLSLTPTKEPKEMLIYDIFGTEPYEFIEYSGINPEKSLAKSKARRNYTTRKITDLNDPVLLSKVKRAICESLSAIGINLHVREFDYMLSHKYGSTDADALRMMMNSTDQSDSIGSFLFFLNTISNGKTLNLDNEGRVKLKSGKSVPLESVYENLAFVKELGNWKYQYRHAHDELTVLATGNNRFYEMSDNDLFSDTLRALNKRNQWYEDLKKDPYNYYTSAQPDANGEYQSYGSYTLDQLTKNPELKLQLKHLIGFKTDKQNDTGQDYFEISRREDYLSKVGILESGGILSLTLSDKKKYVWISGIKLPGLDYSRMLDDDGNILPDIQNALQKTHSERDGGIDLLDSVASQFLSYAMSEYESIKRLANKDIDVANFKKQGKRFSSLLGVWEDKYDKDGAYVGEEFISFNDGNKSWEDNLRTAEKYFFNRTEDEQKALIKRNLNKILDKELATAEKLGLIQKVGTNENSYLNYKNVGLNDVAIKSLTNAYMQKYPGVAQNIAESIAVVVYLNDISAKAIMSGQEMERLLSGNPAFYKWKYNDEGQLVDRTVDELKRLGGLGSTGTNNFTELANMPEKYKDGKYRCAETDNEMTASPQLEFLRDRMYQGELRKNIIYDKINDEHTLLQSRMEVEIENIRRDNLLEELDKQNAILDVQKRFRDDLQAARDRITDDVDNTSIEELETEYEGSEVLNLSREKADTAANSYAGKIDIADGGAYITDEMCEMLLRMEGSWGKEIEEAFNILRGKVKADYLGQAEAYQKVLTSVIGNQKYTAFGRRLQNGVSIPYYHKMALFPIFECIATGKMSNVFDKMKKLGIDMLLINSAVKVGSEGSKAINWSEFRENDDEQNENNFFEDGENGWSWKPTFDEGFAFNTYDVEFAYLRKQLNTDPKEDEMLRMGTQAQKIIFSNLFQGRLYTTQSGEQIKGDALQARIMNSMNELSNLGVQKLNKRFFVTDKEGNLLDADGNIITDKINDDGSITPAQNSDDRQIDIEKFAKEVSRLMSDRGADKNVLKALEVITQGDNKTTTIPLGAISNASWLESVLISMINKDVVDVNTPGAFFIQRSIWAMQGQRMYSRDKGNIIGRQLYDGKRLEMMNEEGSMDCVLSIDYFSHILPKVKSDEYVLDENGDYTYVIGKNGKYKTDQYGNYIAKRKMRDMTFDEAKQWLIDNGIISGYKTPVKKGEKPQWVDAKANIIAYRIPTQAESSIHALRCVDVLPVVRDTVILPEEFTKITGSDFDIDKLGLSTINWKVEDNNKATDVFEEGTEQYYQNRLIRDFLTLLIDPNTTNILHRSIDNDTKLLTDIVALLEGKSTSIEEPYGFYSLATQTERKNDYITGKIGIGPFALNNNNHILTMLYDVRFKNIPGSIMSELGLTNLATSEDFEHNSVMSWISALINAHVDIAKDPYISKLNVNPYTYNLVNTLIRTGFGRNTFYFTTLPIMKELAQAYMNAASMYMANKNKTQYQLLEEAVEEVADAHFADMDLFGMKYEDWKKVFDPKDTTILNASTRRADFNAAFKQLVDNGVLESNANKEWLNTHGAVVEYNNKPVNLTNDQVQMMMYFANLQFDPYAKSVSSLVKYAKIDTKKHGKSYVEQHLYEQGFDELFFDPEGTGLFESYGIHKMAQDSYIETKTRNAIAMTRNILKGQFLLSTKAFDQATAYILDQIGRKGSKDVDLNNKVARIIMAAIKSEFINEYAAKIRKDNPTYIRDLVSESEETFEYTQAPEDKAIVLQSASKYDLESYINSIAYVTFKAPKGAMEIGQRFDGGTFVVNVQEGEAESTYTLSTIITGANTDTRTITTPITRKSDGSGTVRITKGKNTICDRFDRMLVQIKNDPDYKDVLDKAGEPINMLLRSLVHGRTFDYKAPSNNYLGEMPDTYANLKFLKLFNALDQNGVESNYIIDGWDELLHDNKHPLLKEFAEDLVVYAFVTSGDQGGFTKMFKQVPFSWRKESGYGDFIREKIQEFDSQEISPAVLEDAMLNNWFDNDIVRTYYSTRTGKDGKSQIPQFITYSGESKSRPAAQYNPLILAALTTDEETQQYTPSIDSKTAPRFIKVPRRNYKAAKDSQRAYTVYEKIDNGMKQTADGKWITFPIYVKVEPKGNQLEGNYLMTEYGRDDSRIKERTPKREALSKAYKLGDFISRQTVKEMSDAWGDGYSQIVESLNYNDMLRKFKGDTRKFKKAYDKAYSSVSHYEGNITPDADTIFVFGSNPEGRHGAGAAKVAREQFGAVYGQGEGLQGNSYAIPTKDLRVKDNNSYRSISKDQIVESIKKMYEVAKQNPTKLFKVAYRNMPNETTLNGYTGSELIEMFKSAGPIPENVMFSKEWADHWNDKESEEQAKKEGEEIKGYCKNQ